jgi:NADH-quinone oxidoreductase subunit J
VAEAFLGGLVIAAALISLGVVFSKNPISSALSLVGVFVCLASIYAMIGAHFIAALQILVYAGAIMVLFVFAIMLLNMQSEEIPWSRWGKLPALVGLSLASIFFGLMAFVFYRFDPSQLSQRFLGEFSPTSIQKLGGNVSLISERLFTHYVIPFQAVSVLLLIAIVGAVLLAKRHLKD